MTQWLRLVDSASVEVWGLVESPFPALDTDRCLPETDDASAERSLIGVQAGHEDARCKN